MRLIIKVFRGILAFLFLVAELIAIILMVLNCTSLKDAMAPVIGCISLAWSIIKQIKIIISL